MYWVVVFVLYDDFRSVINNRDDKAIVEFGKRLASLRKSKGMTQEELTDKAGLSKNMIGNIERGEVNTTLSTLGHIAEALEIPLKELMG